MPIVHRPPISLQAQYRRDCQACMLACSLYHEGECSLSLARLAVLKDMTTYQVEIVLCERCENPACMAPCPSGAIRIQDSDVALLVDSECTRCGECALACPAGAVFYNKQRDRYLKCDLCVARPGGPACVELCPVGALTLNPRDAAQTG